MVAARPRGRPRGRKRQHPLRLRIERELFERLERVVALEGVKRSEVVRRAILRYCSDVEANRNQLRLPLEKGPR